MARHSKRHNIKHRKAAQDAKKAKVYARIGKMIQMAAKDGPKPEDNPKLVLALTKARENGVPKDIVERAIEKGAGTGAGENLQEAYYEGYGPWGTAVYLRAITSNTNRTSANVRAAFTKFGGNLAEPGAVTRQFTEKGEIFISGKVQSEHEKWKMREIVAPLDIWEIESDILETEAEDYEVDEESVRIVTPREAFMATKTFLQQKAYKIEEADLQFLPTTTIDLDDASYEKLERLLEMLEEDEDIDIVRHNAA